MVVLHYLHRLDSIFSLSVNRSPSLIEVVTKDGFDTSLFDEVVDEFGAPVEERLVFSRHPNAF